MDTSPDIPGTDTAYIRHHRMRLNDILSPSCHRDQPEQQLTEKWSEFVNPAHINRSPLIKAHQQAHQQAISALQHAHANLTLRLMAD